MAGFNTKTFALHDDYMTPRSAWENIKQYIPKNKTIWEAFYGDGTSGDYLKDMGFNVIHEPNIDFFENDMGDIIVSNPPFSNAKLVLSRMKILDKPFILILPSSKLHTNYMREWRDAGLQILIPRKRLQFIKIVDGMPITDELDKKNCNFDCLYVCYKINLPQDIIWLE
jgi:hypothetical protein